MNIKIISCFFLLTISFLTVFSTCSAKIDTYNTAYDNNLVCKTLEKEKTPYDTISCENIIDFTEYESCVEEILETIVETDYVETEQKNIINENWRSEVFIVSGFTSEDYNMILENTLLNGYGSIIYDFEHKYTVNGMWILGVMRQETSFGGGYNGIPLNENAVKKNNFFGLLYTKNDGSQGSISFDTPEDSIEYFCKLMNDDRYYGKSMKSIGNTYCPLDGRPYYKYIKDCMEENYKIIEVYYEQ